MRGGILARRPFGHARVQRRDSYENVVEFLPCLEEAALGVRDHRLCLLQYLMLEEEVGKRVVAVENDRDILPLS